VIQDIEQVDNLTVIWSSLVERSKLGDANPAVASRTAPSERGCLPDSAGRTEENAVEAVRSPSSSWLAETSRIDAAVAATIAGVAATSKRALGYPAAPMPRERFASTAAG